MEEWIKKLWFIDTAESFSAIREKDAILFAGKIDATRDQHAEQTKSVSESRYE